MNAVLWNFVIKMVLMTGSLFFALIAGCLGFYLCLRSVLSEEGADEVLRGMGSFWESLTENKEA